jgi:hypothetical protein
MADFSSLFTLKNKFLTVLFSLPNLSPPEPLYTSIEIVVEE